RPSSCPTRSHPQAACSSRTSDARARMGSLRSMVGGSGPVDLCCAPMKVRAAIAFEAKKPLVIEDVELEGPKAGEVLVQLAATGICHTDDFTLSGADPE